VGIGKRVVTKITKRTKARYHRGTDMREPYINGGLDVTVTKIGTWVHLLLVKNPRDTWLMLQVV
jgi:hypothetical protein